MSAEDAVLAAEKDHARILSADKTASSLAKDTSVAKAELAPHVDATVSYMKKDQVDAIGGEATSAQAMLRLGWNFSVGGAQFARIEKSVSRKKKPRQNVRI